MFRQVASTLFLASVISACTVTTSVSLGDYYRPNPGEILFGSDLDATFVMVRDRTNTVRRSQGGNVAFSGVFTEHVSGDVRLVVVKDEQPVGGNTFTFATPGNYYSGKYHLSDLAPGHYVFQMVQGSKLLAQGELEVME